MAQLVKCPTLAQVMILWFVSSKPHMGLSAVSVEPSLDSLSPSLCPSPLALSISLSKINNNKDF